VELLVGIFFDLGRGFVDLTFKFVTGLLELAQAAAKTFRQFGKLFRPEEEKDDHKDEDKLRSAGHGKGKKWLCHDPQPYAIR